MNRKRIFSWFRKALTAFAFCAVMAVQGSALAGSLQGQNKGDTNTWSSVNLQGWLELDYIPMRV